MDKDQLIEVPLNRILQFSFIGVDVYVKLSEEKFVKVYSGESGQEFSHKDLEKYIDRGVDFVYVPKYDVRASAGSGEIIHSEQIVDFLAFKLEWVKYHLRASEKSLVLISAVGDSMVPTIEDEDLLLIDTSQETFSDDGIYCFTSNDFGLSIKRLQRLPDGVILVKSDNAAYQQYSLSAQQAENIKIIGKVVWSGRKF